MFSASKEKFAKIYQVLMVSQIQLSNTNGWTISNQDSVLILNEIIYDLPHPDLHQDVLKRVQKFKSADPKLY